MLLIFALLGILVCVLPAFGEHFTLVVMLTCINVLLASSMRVCFTVGLWNFGIVGFMAIGAYTTSLLTVGLDMPVVIGLVGAGLASSLVGFALGIPSLRLRGVYFLLLTLGFTEVVRSAAIKWLPSHIYLEPIGFGGIALGRVAQYYFIVLVTSLVLVALYRLEKSRIGLTWNALGQAEKLVEAIGADIYKLKIANLSVSCFVAGLSGGLLSHITGLVTPWEFTFSLMIFIAIWNFAGGIEHFVGPILGAVVLTLVIEPLSGLAHYESIAYAAVVIIVVFFLPKGLVGLRGKILGTLE